MFDFSISSQVRRGGFSIAGGRPSRLNGSVKGVRIKNIPPLSQLKPKITLMAALARSWAAGSKKKGICKGISPIGTQCEPMGLMLCMGQIIENRPADGWHP